MKTRYLHPDVYTDTILVELSDTARLFHLGLALVADDHGVVADEPSELNLKLFPGQPPRPVAEIIDLLAAVGVVERMVAPKGDRVLVLADFARRQRPSRPGKPVFGAPNTFMRLPAPTIAERNAIQSRFGVATDGSSVAVTCEACGVNGSLRFVAPTLGNDDYWGGAVVVARLEIVPGGGGNEPSLLCRSCRSDTSYIAPSIAGDADVIDMSDRRVRQVFEVWMEATGKTSTTKLDSRRRRKIEQALALYPIQDVLDAVVGWKNSPFHRGENEAGRVYNELDLLLRDGAHIEQFRDLARNGPAVPQRTGRRAAANVGTFAGEATVGDWS